MERAETPAYSDGLQNRVILKNSSNVQIASMEINVSVSLTDPFADIPLGTMGDGPASPRTDRSYQLDVGLKVTASRQPDSRGPPIEAQPSSLRNIRRTNSRGTTNMTDASAPQTPSSSPAQQSATPAAAIALPVTVDLPDDVTADLPRLIIKLSLPREWFVMAPPRLSVWEHTTTFSGQNFTSKWHLTPTGPDSYSAKEEGLGNAIGTAIFTAVPSGKHLQINWETPSETGIYDWDLDPALTHGGGKLTFLTGGRAGASSTASHVVRLSTAG
jgi:hypothetical protein